MYVRIFGNELDASCERIQLQHEPLESRVSARLLLQSPRSDLNIVQRLL
jgi:hypothetical protein